MARSVSRSTRYYSARTVQYVWPDAQLLTWRAVMYGAGGTILGIFAAFLQIQQQLDLGIPWLFPFGITVGSLTIVFLLVMDFSILQKNLLPGTVMLGAFVLMILYFVGLIETGIQLFSASSNINSNCNTYVTKLPSSGVSLSTLAWLEQRGICQSWDAVFAFWLIGLIFLIYIIVLAIQVNSRNAE